MDTFRKWWNKPKADDKSVLARFYYADRALTAVASELDSFDGRAEPERCSRLVTRLRQGQEQVLSITNIIMDELLGEDRTPRAFRAKFPEEVLQESLAGQLWFGAECLAAGSSIMNRELESAAMRPLAKAVTKSLDNVRNLLREQCLRIKTPNSLTLNLDFNDSITETLCESLKIFDRLFAEFELHYVSAMVQVKSKQEYEMQELICVLFSETLQHALKIGLVDQEQVDYFDPSLMFSIPRLAIVAGLVLYRSGPLNMSMPADQLSEMFRPFRTLLIKIRDLLRTLNESELYKLQKLLCTNEEIHLQNNSFNCDEKIHNSEEELVKNVISDCCATKVDSVSTEYYQISDSLVLQQYDDINDKESNDNLVSSDCASGYLIPNTNFGNLLQANEAPLTDNFISSDDEFRNDIRTSTTGIDTQNMDIFKKDGDSGVGTENTSLDRTPESENTTSIVSATKNDGQLTTTSSTTKTTTTTTSHINGKSIIKSSLSSSSSSSSSTTNTTASSTRHEKKKDSIDKNRRSKPGCSQFVANNTTISITLIGNPSTSHHIRIKERREKSGLRRTHHNSNYTAKTHSKKRHSHVHCVVDSSDEDTSSSLSEGDPKEVALALRAAGRMKFKSTENLLHRLFVCIAGVADQLQTNFASDLRQILRSVFLMNTTPPQQEQIIDIRKPKETDYFEFRASENDVIQENAGSNQSIYSAEEVNPELENVFEIRQERSASLEIPDPQSIRQINSLTCLADDSDSLGGDNSRTLSDDNRVLCGDTTMHHNRTRPLLDSKNITGPSRSDSQSSDSSTADDHSPVARRSRQSHENLNHNNCGGDGVSSSAIPPRWIPDEDAPRCMACSMSFTTFRRRHHCRNCGRVFCGVCSNVSAPLPKYGLIKAVRVCRDCFVREIGT